MIGDFEKMLIALIVLATVAVLVANKQTAGLAGAAGQFVVSMVQKINPPAKSST